MCVCTVILCTIIVVLLAVVFQQSRAKPAVARVNTTIALDKPKIVDFKNVSEVRAVLSAAGSAISPACVTDAYLSIVAPLRNHNNHSLRTIGYLWV
jgi:hypothetical protein